MNYQYLSSPVGKLRLVSNGESLVAIEFENLQTATIEGEERIDPVLKACGDQLTAESLQTRIRLMIGY